MPPTFRRPPESTFEPEPEPVPDDSFDDLLGAPPPPPVSAAISPVEPDPVEPDPLDQVFPAKETLEEPGYAGGSQQVFVQELPGEDFGGLLGDAPSKPISMLGLDARTDIVEQYGRTQDSLDDHYKRKYYDLAINKGIAPDEAAKQAEASVERFRRIRVDPEGRVTTSGEGGLIDAPPFRESRIFQRRVEDQEGRPVLTPGGYPTYELMYREPDGTFRKPNDFDLMIEAFARQRVLSPEEVERHRAARAATLQRLLYAARDDGFLILNEDERASIEKMILETGTPHMEGYLSALDPESGQVLETTAGATLRGGAGVGAGLINEALFEFTPLFWEQDPETGEPVDPDSFAYRMHQLSREALGMAGYDDTEIERLTKGPMALQADGTMRAPTGTGAMGALAFMPKPFQPTQRTLPTPVDPTGKRVAPAMGSFMGRWAQATTTGRSLGDELMSMPAMRGDGVPLLSPGMGVLADQDMIMFADSANTIPYWVGMGVEMFYPGTPIASGAKMLGKGAARATRAGAQTVRKAAKAGEAAYLADVPADLRFLYVEEGAVRAVLKGAEKAADVVDKAAYVAGSPVQAAKRSRAIRAVQEMTEGRVEGLSDIDVRNSLQSVRRVTGEATAAEVLAPYQVQALLDATTEPVQVRQLVNVVGDSPRGRFVLQEAGLLGRPLSHTVLPQEVNALQRAVAELNADSYQSIVRRLAQGEGTAAERAQLVLAQLHGGGINTKYLPGGRELRAIADGGGGDLTKVLDDMYQRQLRTVQQGPAKPVIGALHELGAQVVRQAQSDEVRRLSGEMGRIMSRRMGGQALTRSTIANRPEEVFAAARAAGGRAVEARIQDIVPDDMVFVSRTLMVPRKMHTEEVVDEVARRVAKMQPEVLAGPRIDGVVQDVFQYPRSVADEVIEGFGADNVAQSRVLSDIVSSIRAEKPLIAEQRMLVEDMLKTRAYEEVLGPVAVEAVGFPASKARQFEIAKQPGVTRGFENAREAEVMRAPLYSPGEGSPLLRDLGVVLSEGGGRQLASTVRRVAKALGAELTDTLEVADDAAPGVREMMEKLKGEFGSIGDNFLREVRDAGLDLVAQGKSPEEAFNIVVNRRLHREFKEVADITMRKAQELQDSLNMTPEQAFFYIAYQRGVDLGEAGLGGAPIPDDIANIAIQREYVGVVKRAWDSVLRNFLGEEVFAKYIDNASTDVVDIAIRQPGIQRLDVPIEAVGDMRPITLKGLRDVVADMREDAKELRGLGASFDVQPIKSRDALLPTLSAWAIGSDVAQATRRAARELKELHPQVFVDLVPTLYSQTPKRLFREASLPLSSRRNVVRSLTKLGVGRRADAGRKFAAMAELEGSPRFKGLVSRAVNEDGRFFVDDKMSYAMKDQGRFVKKLDELSEMITMRLLPADRLDLAEQVLSNMLRTGRALPDTTAMLRSMEKVTSLDLTSMQKQAMYNGLDAIVEGMDGRVAVVREVMMPIERAEGIRPRVPGRQPLIERRIIERAFDTEGDRLLYESIQAARKAGYSDSFILQNMRQTIVETAFKTYISPIVDEMNANMRATGFRPSTGKGSLTSLVRAAQSLDPYDDSVMLLGPEMSEALAALQKSSRTGELLENLETLRRRDQFVRTTRGEGVQLGKYAFGLLADALSLSRRTAAGGLLAAGAIPIPISRYMGMNIATAPLIAQTTVGAQTGLRAYSSTIGPASQMRDVARQVSMLRGRPLVDAVSPRPLTSPMGPTDTGQKLTYGQMRRMIDRNNLGSSRGQVEFTESFNRELTRAAKLMADGAPTPELRQFARQFDPRRTQQLQYIANATDIALRENVFATGIMRGLTEGQAADLARNVVLDYGATPKWIGNTANKYLLFLSFRTANYIATLNALARDPGMFRKLVRMQQINQQRTNAWAYGPDYMKARTQLSKEFIFDTDAGAASFGPGIPAIDAVIDGMSMASYVANLFAENNQALVRLADAAKDENLIPLLTLALKYKDLGSKPMGRGRRVPSDAVEFAIQASPDVLWPYMKDQFNIEAVPPDERLRGRPSAIDPENPEAGPQEYKFASPEDHQKFEFMMYVLLQMGVQRQIIDSTNIAMRVSPSEYLQIKRQGLSSPIMFGLGLSTDLSLRSPEDLSIRALRTTEKAARESGPRKQSR